MLHNRYNENKSMVCEHLKSIISKCNLSGQWSIDIMQNGSEFYIIDMQEAVNSLYYNETVKEDLRKPNSECWVPDLGSKKDRRILKKLKHERKFSCFWITNLVVQKVLVFLLVGSFYQSHSLLLR